jgi:hypothetical protein
MSAEKKAFYEYNSCLMEPWDGPASVVFTDGTMIGATLDRNGLRPSRYYVTKDDYVIMGSEAGVLPVDPANVASKGRLQPGRMFLVNMEEGRIVADEEIKQQIASQKPYRAWLDKNLIKLADIADGPAEPAPAHSNTLQRQLAVGGGGGLHQAHLGEIRRQPVPQDLGLGHRKTVALRQGQYKLIRIKSAHIPWKPHKTRLHCDQFTKTLGFRTLPLIKPPKPQTLLKSCGIPLNFIPMLHRNIFCKLT